MFLRKVLPAFCLCLGIQSIAAQKQIQLEEVRFTASINYLETQAAQRRFAGCLNTILLQYHFPPLADTTKLVLVYSNAGARRSSKISFNDTAALHMTIDLTEVRPGTFFEDGSIVTTDSVWGATKTVFKLHIRMVTNRNRNVLNKELAVLIGQTKNKGVGHKVPYLPLSPDSFVESMNTAFGNIFDPYGPNYVFVAVPPVYATDNYIFPLVAGHKNITVATNERVSNYTYQNEQQVIRSSAAGYEKILLGGKTEGHYPDDLTNLIKSSAGFRHSDFVFFKQEQRDVINNGNYTLVIVTEVNYNLAASTGQYPYKTILAGYFHVLIKDSDTIARFQIRKNILDLNTLIFPGIIFDGNDSASKIDLGTRMAIPVQYAYIVEGTINNQAFEIRCSNQYGRLREIYLNGKPVCMAQGDRAPEVFVMPDSSVSAELLNQLLFLGFNAFFYN